MDNLDIVATKEVNTIYKAFMETVERIPNNNFLGTRVGDEYEWITFRDGAEISETLSLGIIDLDLCPKKHEEGRDWRFMGFMSVNRKEWALTHLAGMFQSITTVPLYESSSPDAIKYIINQTELKTISIHPKHLNLLLKVKSEDDSGLAKTLENLVLFCDEITEEQRNQAAASGVRLLTF